MKRAEIESARRIMLDAAVLAVLDASPLGYRPKEIVLALYRLEMVPSWVRKGHVVASLLRLKERRAVRKVWLPLRGFGAYRMYGQQVKNGYQGWVSRDRCPDFLDLKRIRRMTDVLDDAPQIEPSTVGRPRKELAA